MPYHHRPAACLCSLLLIPVLLASCESARDPQIDLRNAAIAAEPLGDYYLGRRFFIERTHFWGYVRRPRQQWQESKLVILSEKVTRSPDRLPEVPTGNSSAYGFDHNHEYRLWGYFSGRNLYDPNSNLILPEFVLQRYELSNPSPGWLFNPRERFNGSQLLRGEPEATPR